MTQLKIRDGIRRRQRVAALRLPARDEVEALVELGEQARDLGRVVLQVAVDRDDDVALRLLEAGLERGRLAEVAPQPDDADVLVRGVQPRQRGEGAVGRAVVDEDDLPRLARAGRAPTRARRSRSATLRSSSCTGTTTEITALAYVADDRAALDRRGARARARRARRRSSAERVPVAEAAGRVLAADVTRARSTCRRSASSAMDGYAVRAADTPGRLPRRRPDRGRPCPRERALEPGEAMAIATGGVVPDGRRRGRADRACCRERQHD